MGGVMVRVRWSWSWVRKNKE